MGGRPQRRSRELYPLTLVCGHCGVEYNGNRLAKAQRGQRGYLHATLKQRADPDTYERYRVARCIGWFVAGDEIEEKIENLIIRAILASSAALRPWPRPARGASANASTPPSTKRRFQIAMNRSVQAARAAMVA